MPAMLIVCMCAMCKCEVLYLDRTLMLTWMRRCGLTAIANLVSVT